MRLSLHRFEFVAIQKELDIQHTKKKARKLKLYRISKNVLQKIVVSIHLQQNKSIYCDQHLKQHCLRTIINGYLVVTCYEVVRTTYEDFSSKYLLERNINLGTVQRCRCTSSLTLQNYTVTHKAFITLHDYLSS
jgi:hypothetical protein